MLRPAMRDEIRRTAEIAGASSDTGFINRIIAEEFRYLTALAKYDECYTIGTLIAIAANGVVIVPTDLQHYDLDNIYFCLDGSIEFGNRYKLNSFARWRNKTIGRAIQYRLYSISSGGGVARRMELTPYEDIDIANDKVQMDYWRAIAWNTETVEFPIAKLEQSLILRAAVRVCKKENTALARKLSTLAQDAYIGLRAESPMTN